MKIVVIGSHGTGKTTLTRGIYNYLKEDSKMKVCVTGAHGTGKTTLSMFLSGRIKWRYLPESPMQAVVRGFDINENTSLATEWWIIAKQLEMELLTPEPWVSDKCLIDILAYARYLFRKNKAFLRAVDLLKEHINYDLVFYLPSGEFPIADDGFRSLDPAFQREIDRIIIKIMRELNIKYHRLVGNPEQRFMEAKRIIDKRLSV
ncbi:AAA family ATPase [Candidatus Kuenenbacteria bacterium]|nr:AAA family ATPase [Candidatus Kuenenbacteria bacterium]